MDEQKTLLEVAVTTAAGRAEVQSLKRELQELKGEQQALNSEAYDQRASIFTGSGGADTTPAAGRDNEVERVSMLAGAYQNLGETAESASTAGRDLAGATGAASREQLALIRLLARLNPDLAELAALANNAQSAMGLLFSPLGIAAAAAAVSVGLAARAVREYRAETEAAIEKAKEFEEQQRRIKQAGDERLESVADALAKGGVVSQEAVLKGTAVTRRLEDAGASPESIREVLPHVVGEDGKLTVSEQRLLELVANQEYGEEKLEVTDDPREKARSLQTVTRALDRNPAATAKRVRAVKDRGGRERERLTGGDLDAVKKYLAKDGLQGDELEQGAQDVLAIQKGGSIEWDDVSFWTGASSNKVWEANVRQETARQRALAMGLINQQRAIEIANTGRKRGWWEYLMSSGMSQNNIIINGGTANFPTGGFRKQTVPRVGFGR